MSYENESNRGQFSKKLVYLDASCEKFIGLAGSQSQKPFKVHPSTCLQGKPYLKKNADDCSSPSVLWFRDVFYFAPWLDSSELDALTTDGSVSQLDQMSHSDLPQWCTSNSHGGFRIPNHPGSESNLTQDSKLLFPSPRLWLKITYRSYMPPHSPNHLFWRLDRKIKIQIKKKQTASEAGRNSSMWVRP